MSSTSSSTVRVEIPETAGGGWIELHARMTHAEQRRIWRAVKGGDTMDSFEATVAALVVAWDVHDDDGRPIPFPAGARPADGIPIEALDPLPAAAILAAATVGSDIFAARADPNASAASSTGSSPG